MKDAELPTPEDAVVLIPAFLSRPGCAQDLERALLNLQTESRLDSGCVAYTVYRDLENTDRFVLFEEWTHCGALEAHNARSHVKEFLAVADELLLEPFTVTRLSAIT